MDDRMHFVALLSCTAKDLGVLRMNMGVLCSLLSLRKKLSRVLC